MGSTLSTARRRRKTISAANVDYHALNGHDVTDRLMTSSQDASVKSGRTKRASRLLAVFTGRKSATVAAFPADSDVILGNGGPCWHGPNNDSRCKEFGFINESNDKFDAEQSEMKAIERRGERRPKPAGPFGPSRHRSLYSLFSRTSSVGPMIDRVVSVVAFRNSAAAGDDSRQRASSRQRTHQKERVKSSTDDNAAASPRDEGRLSEVRCSRLLSCLDEFIRRRCRLRHQSSLTVSSCVRSIDRDLLSSGWQDKSLVDETLVVFVFCLLSDYISFRAVHHDNDLWTTSVDELRTLICVCLYLSYTYIGCEISYPLRPFQPIPSSTKDAGKADYTEIPLRPFLRYCCNRGRRSVSARHNYAAADDDDDEDDDEEDIVIDHTQSHHSLSSSSSDDSDVSDEIRRQFWMYCMVVVRRSSALMLELNVDTELYADVYRQLSAYATPSHSTAVHPAVRAEP